MEVKMVSAPRPGTIPANPADRIPIDNANRETLTELFRQFGIARQQANLKAAVVTKFIGFLKSELKLESGIEWILAPDLSGFDKAPKTNNPADALVSIKPVVQPPSSDPPLVVEAGVQAAQPVTPEEQATPQPAQSSD